MIYLEGEYRGYPPDWLPPPAEFSNYHNNTYQKTNLFALYVVSEATRSTLKGRKFQNFPGGACPQTPLV